MKKVVSQQLPETARKLFVLTEVKHNQSRRGHIAPCGVFRGHQSYLHDVPSLVTSYVSFSVMNLACLQSPVVAPGQKAAALVCRW